MKENLLVQEADGKVVCAPDAAFAVGKHYGLRTSSPVPNHRAREGIEERWGQSVWEGKGGQGREWKRRLEGSCKKIKESVGGGEAVARVERAGEGRSPQWARAENGGWPASSRRSLPPKQTTRDDVPSVSLRRAHGREALGGASFRPVTLLLLLRHRR